MAPSIRRATSRAGELECPNKRRKTTQQAIGADTNTISKSRRKENSPQARRRQGYCDINQTKGIEKARLQQNVRMYTPNSVSDSQPVVSKDSTSEITDESDTENEKTEAERTDSEVTDEDNGSINRREIDRTQTSKCGDHTPKATLMSKKAFTNANLATEEDAENEIENDARSNFEGNKLREIIGSYSVRTLGLKIEEYLRMVQDENPYSFSNDEELVISLPPAWESRGEYVLSNDILAADTRDEIYQGIFRRGLRSRKQKRTKELIAEMDLSDENLEKQIQRHSGLNGMTKETGAAIPIEDYRTLLRMLIRNCKTRFIEAFKTAWRTTYDGVLLKDRCRMDLASGMHREEFQGNEGGRYNQGGTPLFKIKQYVDAQLRAMVKPEAISSFYKYALETKFNGGHGTDQYELPQFLKDETEATVSNKKVQELLAEWRADRAAQDDAASDDEKSLRSAVLAKDLLEKHLQSNRKRAVLNSEIGSAIDSRRRQEIADWNNHGADQVLEGILRHLVEVVGKEDFPEACQKFRSQHLAQLQSPPKARKFECLSPLLWSKILMEF